MIASIFDHFHQALQDLLGPRSLVHFSRRTSRQKGKGRAGKDYVALGHLSEAASDREKVYSLHKKRALASRQSPLFSSEPKSWNGKLTFQRVAVTIDGLHNLFDFLGGVLRLKRFRIPLHGRTFGHVAGSIASGFPD